MAEEDNKPNELNAGLTKVFFNKLMKQIKESSEEESKSFRDIISDAGDKIEKFNVGERTKNNLQTMTLAQSSEDAINNFLETSGIGHITENIEVLDKSISNVKDTLEKNGQSLDNALLRQLEEEKSALEEIRTYGKALSGFEQTFVKFAGGTFEDMKKSIESGGKLTGQEIAKSFGNDLKGDFDKLLTFFGPISGFLQQIPFLGTLLNLIGNGVKSVLVRLGLSLKRQLFFEGKEDARESRSIAVDAANLRLSQRSAVRDETRFRQEQKDRIARRTGVGQAVGQGDVGETNEGDTKFGFVLPFMTFARFFGKGAGIGLSAIGAGFAALGTGLATGAVGLAKFLVIGGVALGLGLSAIFGAFAFGNRTGAFEGMESFEELNLVKVGLGIAGISAIVAALGALVLGGGIFAVGAGLAAIGLISGGLIAIGTAAGIYAENVGTLAQLDTTKIKENIKSLKDMKLGDLLSDVGGAKFFGSGARDLKDIAFALNFYDKDMEQSIGNLDKLKGAVEGFVLPTTTFGEAVASFFGVGGVDQFTDLVGIDVSKGMGRNLEGFAKGVTAISNAFGSFDDTRIERLKQFKTAMKGMKIENMNFGTMPVNMNNVTPVANQNNQPPIVINAPVNTMQNQNRTNVTKSFTATGSRMMQHSSMHYPSLG
jgi:hypothetical protein